MLIRHLDILLDGREMRIVTNTIDLMDDNGISVAEMHGRISRINTCLLPGLYWYLK